MWQQEERTNYSLQFVHCLWETTHKSFFVVFFVERGQEKTLKHWPSPLPNFIHCEHDQQAPSDMHLSCLSFIILPCICARWPRLACATTTLLWLDCLLNVDFQQGCTFNRQEGCGVMCQLPKDVTWLGERQYCPVFSFNRKNLIFPPCSVPQVTGTTCTRMCIQQAHSSTCAWRYTMT